MLRLSIDTPYPEPTDTSLRAAETRLAFHRLLMDLGLRKEDRRNRAEKLPGAFKSTESYPYSPQPPETSP